MNIYILTPHTCIKVCSLPLSSKSVGVVDIVGLYMVLLLRLTILLLGLPILLLGLPILLVGLQLSMFTTYIWKAPQITSLYSK